MVQQHAEEAAVLRDNRSVLVRAAHISLPLLQRHDARIAAHLDGLGVAGPAGATQCQLALQDPGAGAMFAATVCAIEAQDYRAVEPLLELVTARGPNSAALRRGLLSAFGWVSPHLLRGMGHRLLAADAARLRHLGLDVCRLHGVDPGAALGKALVDADVAVRVTALRTLGELGMVHHQTQVHVALDDPEPSVVVAAAMASCLLDGLDRGNPYRQRTHAVLFGLVRADALTHDHEVVDRALALVMLSSDAAAAAELVHELAAQAKAQPDNAVWRRRLVRACGLSGERRYVGWLIEQMAEPITARLAGESLSLITGVDLAACGLDQAKPVDVESGANEDPNDEDVSLDPDESLPWPNAAAIQAWWARNDASVPGDVRLLMGQAAGPEAAARVLREGGQRQRALAAIALCVGKPGTALFNVAAPAWRQRRLLAGMAPAAAQAMALRVADAVTASATPSVSRTT